MGKEKRGDFDVASRGKINGGSFAGGTERLEGKLAGGEERRGEGNYPDGARKWLKRRGLRRVCVTNRHGPSRTHLLSFLPPLGRPTSDLHT